jgi:predicted metalloprotease with PDZ domain
VRAHYTGALIQPNLIEVDAGSPAYAAGLRTGDQVGCLSIRDGHLLFDHNAAMHFGYAPGTPLNLCVKHADAWRAVSFVPQTRPPAPNTFSTIRLRRCALQATLRFCCVRLF